MMLNIIDGTYDIPFYIKMEGGILEGSKKSGLASLSGLMKPGWMVSRTINATFRGSRTGSTAYSLWNPRC